MKNTTCKRSVTIEDYSVKYKGWDITVPAGSIVDNNTACGNDDRYYFWVSWKDYVEKITGYKNSILAHDLTYYGLIIPVDYCKPYEKQ